MEQQQELEGLMAEISVDIEALGRKIAQVDQMRASILKNDSLASAELKQSVAKDLGNDQQFWKMIARKLDDAAILPGLGPKHKQPSRYPRSGG